MSTCCFVFYNLNNKLTIDVFTFYLIDSDTLKREANIIFDNIDLEVRKGHKHRILRYSILQPYKKINTLLRVTFETDLSTLDLPKLQHSYYNYKTKRLIRYICAYAKNYKDEVFDYSSLSDDESKDDHRNNRKEAHKLLNKPLSKDFEDGKFGTVREKKKNEETTPKLDSEKKIDEPKKTISEKFSSGITDEPGKNDDPFNSINITLFKEENSIGIIGFFNSIIPKFNDWGQKQNKYISSLDYCFTHPEFYYNTILRCQNLKFSHLFK